MRPIKKLEACYKRLRRYFVEDTATEVLVDLKRKIADEYLSIVQSGTVIDKFDFLLESATACLDAFRPSVGAVYCIEAYEYLHSDRSNNTKRCAMLMPIMEDVCKRLKPIVKQGNRGRTFNKNDYEGLSTILEKEFDRGKSSEYYDMLRQVF